MRIVRICGFDSSICEKYPVEIDKDGKIKEVELKCCSLSDCKHCGFLGDSWARIELIAEE